MERGGSGASNLEAASAANILKKTKSLDPVEGQMQCATPNPLHTLQLGLGMRSKCTIG